MKLTTLSAWIIIVTIFGSLLDHSVVAQNSLAGGTVPPEGFESSFNGEDLSGWYAVQTQSPRSFDALSQQDQDAAIAEARKTTAEHWRVEDGEIVNDGSGPYLTTEQKFGDYELLIEYKTVAGADSGVYLKGTPQVQIWDSTDESKFDLGADKGSGGLWNNSSQSPAKHPLAKADNPFGQWNQLKIRQLGSRTTVYLNGVLVVDHAVMENRHWGKNSGLPLINRGPIQLQTHGGEIRWRNIFVREIPVEEANELLRSKDKEGFASIVKGNTFDGWSGPLENYELNDGVIKCKPQQGGTIFTDEEYSDFAVRLEFRLPPGGNNGLAIRYPGEGDTAYVGMCELQVLDNDYENFKGLDDRQYHGSAYGMAAAHQGYLRETGQWNFQEVTVKGSIIKVELNGNVILDCDLGDVTEYLDDKPHPGKANKSGHFGLAGHNDPVEFKNLEIKVLK